MNIIPNFKIAFDDRSDPYRFYSLKIGFIKVNKGANFILYLIKDADLKKLCLTRTNQRYMRGEDLVGEGQEIHWEYRGDNLASNKVSYH